MQALTSVRIRAGAVTLLVHVALLYLLLVGLAGTPLLHTPVSRDLLAFTLPPPPPTEAQHLAPQAAAPAPPTNRIERREPPPPRSVTITPLPAPPAPMVDGSPNGIGIEGAKGSGLGSGRGGTGAGTGDGGSPPLLIKGRIVSGDYPPDAYHAGVSGKVGLRFVVDVRGRVRDCRVTRSSGDAELDETTCRLITRRFRYQPATDADGRPVEADVVGDHDWVVARPPPAPDDEDDDGR